MWKPVLLVALGSALGGICRYLMQQALQKHVVGAFPLGTLAVNILGCFVIGLVTGMATRTNLISPAARLFLSVGICGGFTTFSSFMMENFTLSQSGQVLSMTLYVGLSLIVGYMATMAGMYLVKFI